MSSADGGPVVNAMAGRLQPVLVLVGVIWAVEIVNLLTGHVLVSWGILPRSLSGLMGIALAPLIHGGLWHTLSNTVPLALLGTLTLASGRKRFWQTTIAIALLSGALVWLFAREAYHVGASSLVFGYFGAILARAFTERSLSSMAIAFATLVIYGGLLWGLLPLRNHISFEGHLFGFVAGIAVVWIGRRLARE